MTNEESETILDIIATQEGRVRTDSSAQFHYFDIINWIESKKKQWQEESYIKRYEKGSGKKVIGNTALVEGLFSDIKPKGKK